MSHGLALSTARSGEIYTEDIRSSLSLIDVLYANQFEGESFHQELLNETEENFYRGAPPKWLNFHISEQADGTGMPFIKRDGYDTLVKRICERRKRPGTSSVKLLHEPGCGGTTLAMKVLWDLRKTFRCAVLTASDITNLAEEVVHLFTAGSRGHQNTVLLLVNNKHNLENLQGSVRKKMAELKIVAHKHVVILLNCVRMDVALKDDSDDIVLTKVLTDTEKQKFNEKNKELRRKYGDKCKQFHGLNIMQTNFSPTYIQEACSIVGNIRSKNRPRKTQLVAILSLLNDYVPGSYLLQSQCLDFFKHGDYIKGDAPLEDRMEPFSHLTVTFQQDRTSDKKVCMAHPMIAQHCTELMAEAQVTRSDTVRNFLSCFCKDNVPPFLLGFVKDMLTKRAKTQDQQERFSRLILDIQNNEAKEQSVSALKMASRLFNQDPFFPQALARFYYLELQDYNLAEMWAERAKTRDPQNSFIADTLGQVHKNHLQNTECSANPRSILQLASKAIKAFKEVERFAENEHGGKMKGEVNVKFSAFFNTLGKLGYLQVCNIMYRLLVRQNDTWHDVLRNKVSLCSVLESLGDNKLFRFNDLIISLRDEIERKCAFFNTFLDYSKPGVMKNDRQSIFEDVSQCYVNYVGNLPSEQFKQKGTYLIQELKRNRVDTSAGVLQCLDRECTDPDHKEMTWWEEVFLQKDSVRSLVNDIVTPITSRNLGTLSDEDPPELHMLTLLLCWPTSSEEKCVPNLSQFIEHMHRSYERTYKKRFRSRYLCPLFFIGRGQSLNRIVNRERHLLPLLEVEGVVRNYRLFATIGQTEIKVDAKCRKELWRERQVSFHLGFNIRGPVAVDIRTKSAEKKTTEEASGTDTPATPRVTTGGQSFVDRHHTAMINRVTDTGYILTKLKDGGWISNETYEAVRSFDDTQDQMSGILQCLISAGKDALFEILRGMRSMRPLIAELQGSE